VGGGPSNRRCLSLEVVIVGVGVDGVDAIQKIEFAVEAEVKHQFALFVLCDIFMMMW
jgi:hypothetical protein